MERICPELPGIILKKEELSTLQCHSNYIYACIITCLAECECNMCGPYDHLKWEMVSSKMARQKSRAGNPVGIRADIRMFGILMVDTAPSFSLSKSQLCPLYIIQGFIQFFNLFFYNCPQLCQHILCMNADLVFYTKSSVPCFNCIINLNEFFSPRTFSGMTSAENSIYMVILSSIFLHFFNISVRQMRDR